MKHFLSVLFFVTVWMLVGKVSLAQSDFSKAPVSELSERQIRFRAMEQRALELSQRLSKMSGTEPIQLIDRNESMAQVPLESPAQESYDSLPGPIVEPLVLPEKEEAEKESIVFSSEVSRVAPTNQQRKGDYYFMPLLGIVASSSVSASYKDASHGIELDDSLEGGWGNSVGFNAGKRWDNWYSDISLSYQYQKYSHPNFFHHGGFTTLPVTGIEESFALSLGGGYSVPLTEKLSHSGGMGVGFAWRRNSLDGELLFMGRKIGSLTPKSVSSLVFSYDFSLGLEYLFINNFSGYLGYKFLGMTKNKDFGSSFQHLIELGVGANF